jgi:hypothetical protein
MSIHPLNEFMYIIKYYLEMVMLYFLKRNHYQEAEKGNYERNITMYLYCTRCQTDEGNSSCHKEIQITIAGTVRCRNSLNYECYWIQPGIPWHVGTSEKKMTVQSLCFFSFRLANSRHITIQLFVVTFSRGFCVGCKLLMQFHFAMST